MLFSRYTRGFLTNATLHSVLPIRTSVRYYTKHRYEIAFSRLVGPLWVFLTPGFLQSYVFITAFFLLLLYPLDPYLFNVRKLKADIDSKIGS